MLLLCECRIEISLITTGVDLSKILVGQTKILGGKVVKSDKYIGVSQLLGARARAAFKSTPMLITE